MRDAQKPDHLSLNTLISHLREGRYVIPDFQRDFEWEPGDISALMRSILLDYYIGSLLLWRGKKENFESLACEPLYGHPGDGSPEHIVLDGQQRLTAMYYTFLAPDKPLPNRRNRFLYFVRVDRLMADEPDEAFYYTWLRGGTKLLNDREAQFASNVFPLAVIGRGGWELPNWVQGYEKYWREKEEEAEATADPEKAKLAAVNVDNAARFGELLKGITEQYQIAYIELDRDLEVDKVCDIFTQVNSRGQQLDVFDLVNALLKPKGLQLKHMWRKAKSRLEFVESKKMNVYILQVMSILRQAYCSPKYIYYLLPGQAKQVRDPDGTRRTEVLVADTEEFEKRWNVGVDAMEGAIDLLRHPQEFGAISSPYLPYVSILPVFSALQWQIKNLPANERLEAQRRIRQWYWASVFTNRYSGSVESTAARDFLDVTDWIKGAAAEPGVLLEFKNRFKDLELRKEVKRGTSVYNGIFNLLILNGARDWMTGNVTKHGDLDDHHIVPASWGRSNLKGDKVHSILNRSPLTADTNRNIISDRLPNAYLPDLIKKNSEAAVRGILESHFISDVALKILLRDPFTPADFEAFIAERQQTFQDAIENLLIKERLDLPPHLRELDEKVEQAELGLRRVVDELLSGTPDAIPPHIAQKIEERILRATKRAAGFDTKFYSTLPGRLEFCDLRDLQEIITAKPLWPHFTSRFPSKEALIGKLDQLAELRNGIRHNRTVDEVTRKEGEAAILWFQKVLA